MRPRVFWLHSHGFAGLFVVELSAQRTRDMNQAGTSFPATPCFFELAGTGLLRVAAFAFRAVPAIELESHKTRTILEQASTLLHAEMIVSG